MCCAELSSAGQLEFFGMYVELLTVCSRCWVGQYGLTSIGHIVGVGLEVRRADGLLETAGSGRMN